jgi:hypothetical protein
MVRLAMGRLISVLLALWLGSARSQAFLRESLGGEGRGEDGHPDFGALLGDASQYEPVKGDGQLAGAELGRRNKHLFFMLPV